MFLRFRNELTELLKRESFKKILKSIKYLSSERLIKLVVGIVIHAWLARYLGPEKFGRLSYILNFVSIFLPFVTFGLDDVLTKHFLDKKHEVGQIVSTQIKLRLVFGGVAYFLLFLFVSLDPEFEFNYKLMILIYGLTLFLRVFDVIEILYQSALNLRPVFWARNLSYLSSSSMKVVGIVFKTNLSFFLFTYLWEVFSWKLINIITYFKSYKLGRISSEHRFLFLKEAMPLFWGAFIVMLDLKLGNITLKKFHGDESVGNFSIVMILVELWSFLPAAICASLYPAIFNSKMGKSGAYRNRLQLLYDFLFWLGLIFAISVSIASPFVVKVLYGSKFPELPELLMISSWLGVLSFLSFARVKYYALESRLGVWVTYSLISLIINVCLQLYFVPEFHEKAAIYSMICSPYISLAICSLFSPFVRGELKILGSCLLAPIRIATNKVMK